MEALDSGRTPILSGLVTFVTAPLRLRTYTNAIFLALAFPLGLVYFVFLIVGFSLGIGLTIVWLGLPILGAVFLGSWALAALERQMAIHLLGARVPPRSPAARLETPIPISRRIGEFFGNPVTWKGIAYLFLKFPLGIVSFVSLIALSVTSIAFILAPFGWQFGAADLELDGTYFVIDSPWVAWALLPFGLLLLLTSLNLFNGLAWVWREMATALLGSERFRAAAPAAPEPPAATSGPTPGILSSALPA